MTQPGDKALARTAEQIAQRSQAVDPARRASDDAMDRYARGDDAAFDRLYAMTAPRVRSFLLRMCGNLALAEDLTQETFLRVSRARGSFEERAAAIPWIISIARNALFDHARRARTRGDVPGKDGTSAIQVADPDTRGDEVLAGREMFDVVRAALDRLTVQQREAFVLLRFEGLSVAEAAVVLGTTPGAVKIRAFRAYEALRAAIEKSTEIRGGHHAR
ncbi:MAG TPA: RNA polymerase sigma factor [Polyangiaceae bacterium]|nr:RNA polymerase sigma factor [Polyangiaceae bacterium]